MKDNDEKTEEVEGLEALSDVGTQGVIPDVPNRKSFTGRGFRSEYGIRVSDDAMVFHFYPEGGPWSDDFVPVMEESLLRNYPMSKYKLTGGYVPELDSFWVIVAEAGRGMAPLVLAERFLSQIGQESVSGASSGT